MNEKLHVPPVTQTVRDRELTQLKRYAWILVIFWTVILGASFSSSLYQLDQGTKETARIHARDAVQMTLFFRRWNANHGGVYAPVTEETLPNPYLDVPERDIQTPSGRQLTLINPAYMTRQILELQAAESGLLGHITSLNPIRPENAADPWETTALRAFERGETEESALENINGVSQMRLMLPLPTEEICLKCHASQGYKLGDIRGGISMSVPMVPLRAIERSSVLNMVAGHSLLWVVGMVGVALGTRRLGQGVRNRKRAEKALKEYSEQLEEMVLERTQELHNAQESLIRKEKLAVLGQLAGGVAHELRNPLAVIKNAAYCLNLVLEEPDVEIREMLEILDKQVGTADKIISSLLDFARTRPPIRRKVDVNDVVRETLSRTPLPDAPRVEVVLELDEDLPPILADPDQLVQVFGNLVRNGVQAMSQGGQVTIKTSEECRGDPGGRPEWVTVSVADSGAGISEENLKKIFEPLFTTKAKGIGLGLALVKTLVEGHGGTIGVESQVGEGSTFTVRLPIVERKEKENAHRM